MTDSAILEEIRDQFGWSNIKLRWFVDRQGIVRPTVLVLFSSSEKLEEAKRKSVFLDNVNCEIGVFEPKASITQCFNCYGFDHTVVWCPKKQKVCPHCSQSHKPTEISSSRKMILNNLNVLIVEKTGCIKLLMTHALF